MEGTRKNVGSEYKKVGKWGFVPKLGVTLLAALIILSLAGCKNTADGGVGSSGGGGAPAVPVETGNRIVHTFYNKDTSGKDIYLGGCTVSETKTFSEIKQLASQQGADFSKIEVDPFDAWEYGEGKRIASVDQEFSASTKFTVRNKEPDTKPIEKGEDLVGETSNAYGWYSEKDKSFIIFSNEEGASAGEGVVIAGQSFSVSLNLAKEYLEKDAAKYSTRPGTPERTKLDDELKEFKETYGIGTFSWWTDNGDWNADSISIMFHTDEFPFVVSSYNLGAKGDTLIDTETGEDAYTRVD